jgi:hypothetical protein
MWPEELQSANNFEDEPQARVPAKPALPFAPQVRNPREQDKKQNNGMHVKCLSDKFGGAKRCDVVLHLRNGSLTLLK